MLEYDRTWIVKRILCQYVQSPSLKHLRDDRSLSQVANTIVKELEPKNPLWERWDKNRALVIRQATGSWVPVPDLHMFLNELPGPRLTFSDVQQRLSHEEDLQQAWLDPDLRDSCQALYVREKEEGTEFFAILLLLASHIEREGRRKHEEREAARRKARDDEYASALAKLMLGADSKWVRLRQSKSCFCRLNGRTYRLTPCQAGRWQLHRVQEVQEGGDGVLIGRYGSRREATKVIQEIAFNPDVK